MSGWETRPRMLPVAVGHRILLHRVERAVLVDWKCRQIINSPTYPSPWVQAPTSCPRTRQCCQPIHSSPSSCLRTSQTSRCRCSVRSANSQAHAQTTIRNTLNKSIENNQSKMTYSCQPCTKRRIRPSSCCVEDRGSESCGGSGRSSRRCPSGCGPCTRSCILRWGQIWATTPTASEWRRCDDAWSLRARPGPCCTSRTNAPTSSSSRWNNHNE